VHDSDLRLLASNGGSKRGWAALIMPTQLLEAVDIDALLKPCDDFDIIGRMRTGK
jgi:hypothetical protein